MKITVTDIAMGATMIVSLAALHVMAPLPLFYTGLFCLPPAVFFAISLCETFLLGLRAARETMRANSDKSPGRRFRSIMAPRAKTWIVLWGGYFFLWEATLYPVVDRLGPATCLMALSVMTAACLLWAPRFSRLLPLVLLVLVCVPVAVVAFWFLALMLLTALAEAKLWDPGYMSMGLAFGPPLLAAMAALAVAPATWIWSLWKSDAWFAERGSTSKENAEQETVTATASIDRYLKGSRPYRWFRDRKEIVYGLLAVCVFTVIILAAVLRSNDGQSGGVTCLDVVKNVFGRPVRAAVGEHFACYTLTAHFNVLDISHPSEQPTQTASTWLSAEDSHALAASGDRVFMADGSGLTIFDVSDMKSPRVLGKTGVPGRTSGTVAVSGTLAFTAHWDIKWASDIFPRVAGRQDQFINKVNIIDVSNPSTPHVVGSVESTHDWPVRSGTPVLDVAASGSLVLCACGPAGLVIVDASAPSSPVLACTYEDGDNFVRGADVVGSTAFVTSSLKEGSSCLRILDLTTPSKPVVLASLETPGTAQDVSVSGLLAYVTLGGAGMLIVDISDPSSPRVCESYRPYAQGRLEIYFSTVNARGSLVLVDNRRGPTEGLHLLKYSLAQDQSTGHPSRKEPTR